MKRVLLAGIKHETNTFTKHKTDLEHFKERHWRVGEDIIRIFDNTNTECGGIIAAASKLDIELLPAIIADAQPGGIVTSGVFKLFCQVFTEKLGNTRVDGIILVLHGAMVVEDLDDGDGQLLCIIRDIVGTDIPIVVTLDAHANFSAQMHSYADVFVGYDTYPHVDMYQRGYEACLLLHDIIEGKIKPVTKYRRLPAAGITFDTNEEPLAGIMRHIEAWENLKSVLNITLLQGFKHADTQIMGISVIVTTDNNPELAIQLVNKLSALVISNYNQLLRPLTPMDEALEIAVSNTDGVVILAEGADNPGAGAPGDSTNLLQAMLDKKVKNALFVMLIDPESVRMAIAAGVGNMVQLMLGGKIEQQSLCGKPIVAGCTVKTITDGIFTNQGKMNQGIKINVGRLVVVELDGVEIMLAERRHQPYDAEIVRRVGINPAEKKIIAIKSMTHFKSTFGHFAKRIIDVDSPGIASMKPHSLPYKKISRPMLPFDELTFADVLHIEVK